MPASLFGERFLGVRVPAWHKLGVVIDEPITAIEAIKKAGIDYQYVKAPIGYTLPDGTFEQQSDRVAILRSPTDDDPTYRRLGFSSNSYQFLQNEELAAGLDAVTERTGWKLETVGALGNGETVFMSLFAGDRDVMGDQFHQYLLVSDGKVAGRALNISVTPVRVVCQNTLWAADDNSSIGAKVFHNDQVAMDYGFWLDLIPHLQSAIDGSFDAMNKMASTKISILQAKAIIDAAYPLPSRNGKARMAETVKGLDIDEDQRSAFLSQLEIGQTSFEYWTKYTEARREAALELYERINDNAEQGGQLPKKVSVAIASTPYAALQAVAELADWSGGTEKSTSTEVASLFGNRAGIKARAWNAALAAA